MSTIRAVLDASHTSDGPGTSMTGQVADRVFERLGRTPLALHVAALALVLLALMPLIGTQWAFSADEGAALAQAQLLHETGDWVAPFPLPEVLPGAVPFEQAVTTGEGYLPFAKHPVYPVVLWSLLAIGGTTAAVLLSVAGTLLAAAGGALVARDLHEGLERTTLWTLGLASPLLFDSYLVIAHTLGAAAAIWGFLTIRRAVSRRSIGHAGLGLLAFVLGALLRNEVVLLGVVVSGIWVLASLRRGAWHIVLWGVPGAAAIGAYLLDPRLVDLVMSSGSSEATSGGTASFTIRGGSGPSWWGERLDGLAVTVLRSSYVGDALAALALVVPIALSAMVVVAARRPQDTNGVTVFGALAAAAAVVWAVLEGPGLVPGLLVAFPLLAAGTVAIVSRWSRLDRVARLLVLCWAAFAVMVLATQYSTGGSGEWGGRYFAVGLPFVVPPVLVALRAVLTSVPVTTRTMAVGAMALASAAFACVAVLTLRAGHESHGRLVAAVQQAQQDRGAPVVLSAEGALGRFNWREAAEQRWITVTNDDAVHEALDRLERFDVGPVLVVERGDDGDPVPGSTERLPLPGGWWASVVPADE